MSLMASSTAHQVDNVLLEWLLALQVRPARAQPMDQPSRN